MTRCIENLEGNKDGKHYRKSVPGTGHINSHKKEYLTVPFCI
jgi:hypothetical protein